MKYKRVVTYTRSPMNDQRWMALLDCEHAIWITARRKPTAKVQHCPKCDPICEAQR